MTTSNDKLSVEDAFDQLMDDPRYSSKEPSADHAATDQTDTITDANATDTNTVSTDTTSTDNTTDTLEADDIDWKAKAAEWEHKFKSFEGRMQAELARRREDEDRRQQQYLDTLTKMSASKDTTNNQTAAQLSKFKQLREDFPEIADAVEEYIKSEFTVANDLVQKELSSKIDPLVQNLSRVQVDSHLGRIYSKHPDAEEVSKSAKFEQWVDSLPPFAKAGALHVLSLGSSDEVISLLDQYKSSINQNQTNTTAKPNVKDNQTTVSSDLVAAVKSGLAVKSDRSSNTPKTTTNVTRDDDFDAAWDEAVALWEKAK